MQTNYGKLAYQKTEDILKELNKEKDYYKSYYFIYRNVDLVYTENLFTHTLFAKEGSVVTANISLNYVKTNEEEITITMYLDDGILYSGDKENFTLSFVAGKTNNISFKFTTSDSTVTTKVDFIKCEYLGKILNEIDFEPVYFDDNMTYFCTYYNGKYTRHISLNNLIRDYKYSTQVKELYSVNSLVNANRKSAIYGLLYKNETEKLTLKYLYSGKEYGLKTIKPDDAIFTPISSTSLRVFYLLNNKIYYFTSSSTGTNIGSETELEVPIKERIKRLFPIRLVTGNTNNVNSFGIITDEGIYVIRYNSTSSKFDSKKFIGKGDYASGFFTNNSITIVLYNNMVATLKTYSDRMLTNLIEIKKYYNYFIIYKTKDQLLGLNYNGFNILTT